MNEVDTKAVREEIERMVINDVINSSIINGTGSLGRLPNLVGRLNYLTIQRNSNPTELIKKHQP